MTRETQPMGVEKPAGLTHAAHGHVHGRPYNPVSPQVAVEKTGMQITKLISSLRLQQTIYRGIYTTKAMRTDQCMGHVCICFYQLGVDNEL